MKSEDKNKEFVDEQENIETAAREFYKPQAESYADYIEMEEKRTVGKLEREDILHGHIESQILGYHHRRADSELSQYHVNWDIINSDSVEALKQALVNAEKEEDMQRFLTDNSVFLIQHFGGGHGRYVIPKPRLGSELIPDYFIAETSSIGIEWHGIELESPIVNGYTTSGQPSHYLTHSIQQIIEWRAWLESFLAYARTPKSNNGLGLVGITSDLSSTILIGRRATEIPPTYNNFRRQTKSKQNIEIHTYDWLVEQAEIRVQSLRH